MPVSKFDIEAFANILRATRLSRRITCRGLERVSGISNAFINQIENHKRVPTINSILWLCNWMEVPLDRFIIHS